MPEGNLALAEVAVYLATASKSNSLDVAYRRVKEQIKGGASEQVPQHLRNPVTRLDREMGVGEGYKYAHDYPDHFVEQQHLPDALKGRRFYTPGKLGYERQVQSQMKARRQIKETPEEAEDADDTES